LEWWKNYLMCVAHIMNSHGSYKKVFMSHDLDSYVYLNISLYRYCIYHYIDTVNILIDNRRSQKSKNKEKEKRKKRKRRGKQNK